MQFYHNSHFHPLYFTVLYYTFYLYIFSCNSLMSLYVVSSKYSVPVFVYRIFLPNTGELRAYLVNYVYKFSLLSQRSNYHLCHLFCSNFHVYFSIKIYLYSSTANLTVLIHSFSYSNFISRNFLSYRLEFTRK